MHAHHILIIDDEPAIRDVLGEFLSMEGHGSLSAIDGADAMRQLEGGLRPCLILLDLLMPHMSGWQLAERLAASPELAGIPYLVTSAQSSHPRDEERLEARPRISKPFHLAAIMEMIDAGCLEGLAAKPVSVP